MGLYRIIALGDSLTYGYPFGNPLSWVQLVSNELDIVILNQGVNGDTLSHLLRRLNMDVLDIHPEYCLVLGGTNDVYQGVSLELMQSNFTKLIDRLTEHSVIPVLGLPPPVQDPVFEKILAKYRTWLKRYAKENSLKVINFYDCFLSKNKRILPATLEDGVHPSSKGYQLMAQAALKVLKDLVKD